MKLAIASAEAGESRVALVPQHIPALQKQGFHCHLERGAGSLAGFSDYAYQEAAAKLHTDLSSLYTQADYILSINPPPLHHIEYFPTHSRLISFLHPQQNPQLVQTLRAKHIQCLPLESIPRTSANQHIDVLTSQSVLQGYQAAVMGAASLGYPMHRMTTAAMTLKAAKVLIIGAGVAGLQAMSVCVRMGAEVWAMDTRPETANETQSVGANYLASCKPHELQAGGLARCTDPTFLQQQRAFLHHQINSFDLIITTAESSSSPPPILITDEMLSPRPLSIVELGKNSSFAQVYPQLSFISQTEILQSIAPSASLLFSSNIVNILSHKGLAFTHLSLVS